MILDLFGFLKLSFIDILDVILVAFIIFLFFRWMRNSAALNIFLGILFIYVLMVIVDALHMKLMSKLVSTFIDVGVVALIVIFQPEIRHFLMKVGSNSGFGSKGGRFLNKILGHEERAMEAESVREIASACQAMSETKTGALIVLPHKVNLNYIIEQGDRIDAKVSRRLIMNIFFKNSPLHDGAMIISNDRIVAARCTLPITARTDIPASFGMRHKASIGMTEESDADVIVVSEETGRISFVRNAVVTPIENINELNLLLGGARSSERGDSSVSNPEKEESVPENKES